MSVHGGTSPVDDDATRVIGAGPADPVDDPERTVVKPPPGGTGPSGVPSPAPGKVPRPSTGAPAVPARPLRPRSGMALALPAGFRLHEYRIDRVLGQGGFGITYLATDVNLNTRVAIKEYLPEEIAFRKSGQTVSAHSSRYQQRYRSGLDSFLVEARTLATFRHPHIVRVARFFEAHQTAYMVLEYERGSPLKTWWPAHADLPEKELMRLLQPLLDGLAVVHAAGFLHRDIKPDNIQVRAYNGSLVLLDFGSARQAVSSGAQDDVAVTPGYAPIEQYEDGHQGPWTDIYGMGATLYWLVTGEKPPEAPDRLMALSRPGGVDPLQAASQRAQGRFSASFLAAIDWALSLHPQQRPQDIAQWRRALFAAYASSLGLQEALRAGDGPSGPKVSVWTVLTSPTLWGPRLRRGWRMLTQPASWPIAVKMTLAMVLTALMPMLVAGYYNVRGSVDAVSAAEIQNLQQLARSTAGRVTQLISDGRHLARALASDEAFVAFLSQPDQAGEALMRAKLERLVQANPDIHLMMIMDPSGTAVVSSDPEVTGRNFRFREYFQAAMQGKEHVTGMVVGAVTGKAGMFYAHPVLDDNGQVLGAVVLRIRAEAFSAILDDVGQGSGLTPFIVDGDGVVIDHPDPRAVFSSLAPLKPVALAEIQADQRFGRSQVASLGMPDLAQVLVGARQPGYVSYQSALSGKPEVAGYAPVAGHEWVVAVSEARATFEAPIKQLFQQLLWSTGLIGLLFVGLALMFARTIVRPVRALTRAADALKRGDYAAASLVVRSRDEIGQLSRTFNVLIDVLRQRERERDEDRPGGSH